MLEDKWLVNGGRYGFPPSYDVFGFTFYFFGCELKFSNDMASCGKNACYWYFA